MSNYYLYEGVNLPRQSIVTGQLDKSGPLTYWAANCAVDYIIEELHDPGDKEWALCSLMPIFESARKNFRKVSKKALDIGSQVHKAIETWLRTGVEPENPSPEVLSGFVAFLEWIETHKTVQTIETEKTVYAPKWAGTYDWLVNLDGITWLIDFKTSKQPRNNKPYEEWRIQTAGYRSQEPRAEKNAILRLDKETGFPDFYDLSDTYEQDIKVFDCLVNLWWLRHPNHE